MRREDGNQNEEYAVVLFDGVCNLCQASVRFIIPRDRKCYFRFASLQSAAARQLLYGKSIDLESVDSVVLIENGNVYTESTAALRICRKLRGGWALLYGLIIIPRSLRNAIYGQIAKRRYRWFGRTDACMLPTPEHRLRFIDDEKNVKEN